MIRNRKLVCTWKISFLIPFLKCWCAYICILCYVLVRFICVIQSGNMSVPDIPVLLLTCLSSLHLWFISLCVSNVCYLTFVVTRTCILQVLVAILILVDRIVIITLDHCSRKGHQLESKYKVNCIVHVHVHVTLFMV